MKTRLAALFTLVWCMTTGASAPVRMTPVKIADNVYMLQHSQGSGNSTVIFTDQGVVVFDFHIDNADQTLAFIRKTTDKKVKYLITSHSAGDHASGAWHFREDAPAWIATKNQVHDLQMQEREEFLERKKSNDPRNAAYQKGEPLTPDHRHRWAHDALLRRLDLSNHSRRSRPQHRRPNRLYSAKARDAHGRSARHRNPPRPRRVRRSILLQRRRLDASPGQHHGAPTSPWKLIFPVMVRRISAAASKTWRSKSATSW